MLAPERDPVFITWFNPEPAKGLWLMARLAERLGKERPDRLGPDYARWFASH